MFDDVASYVNTQARRNHAQRRLDRKAGALARAAAINQTVPTRQLVHSPPAIRGLQLTVNQTAVTLLVHTDLGISPVPLTAAEARNWAESLDRAADALDPPPASEPVSVIPPAAAGD